MFQFGHSTKLANYRRHLGPNFFEKKKQTEYIFHLSSFFSIKLETIHHSSAEDHNALHFLLHLRSLPNLHCRLVVASEVIIELLRMFIWIFFKSKKMKYWSPIVADD